MKLSRNGLEGTPQEIKDFFQDNGLRAKDYLTQPDRPPKNAHFIIPSIIYVAAAISILFVPRASQALSTMAFILGSIGLGWLAVSLQLRYKNVWAATFVVILGIPLLLVAIGLIAPLDLLDQLRQLRK